MIAIMGATGHTGMKIAHALLRRGDRVRALGRTESKLVPLAGAGADVLTGDAADPKFLADAFRGADAVYTLLPTDRCSPDYFGRQQQEGEAIAEAIRESRVRYVVALSALGADLGDNTGLIAGLHAQEQRLKRLSGANVTLLRPVSFFENFSDQLAFIEQRGILADSVIADLAIPMIATRDVADAAVTALTVRDWTGVIVRELLGPRDLTHAEVARLLGTAIGRTDLRYAQLSDSDMTAALVHSGYSVSFATLYVEMTRAFNEGRVKPRQGRTRANTTRTRFEDFVTGQLTRPDAHRMPAGAAPGSRARPDFARG
jgi:uncharacterized protein YbjT (DUF2867 family)